MRRVLTMIALITFAAAPFAAFAGQDEAQRQIPRRLQEPKLELGAAENAQGAERDQLMQVHMMLMQETMGRMQAIKLRDGITLQEQKEWMTEHQKLMDQMMGQMMEEHHMMMQGMPMKGMPGK